MPESLFLGDITGFAALAFLCLSAFMMAFRAKLVTLSGGTAPLRNAHVIVSLLGTVFLALHIGILFNLPVTIPLDLGYGAFALGLFLWATGIGFLERNRDSYFLHGSTAVALVALVVVHAASSGINFPEYVAVPALIASGSIALLSGALTIKRPRPKAR
ncbi:MAG: hypothetical protein JRM73_02470 [Nitrososphaerota archaeon]|nr:hypothetical protein [Nitrososphaerota archaeon]